MDHNENSDIDTKIFYSKVHGEYINEKTIILSDFAIDLATSVTKFSDMINLIKNNEISGDNKVIDSQKLLDNLAIHLSNFLDNLSNIAEISQNMLDEQSALMKEIDEFESS